MQTEAVPVLTLRALVLLVVLLLLVAVGLRLEREGHFEGTPEHLARVPGLTDRSPPEHSRVSDEAGILEPFGPRLGRMTDAFHEDLGIDVHVVTRTDSASPIELQANLTYKERNIGVDARTGGLLVILNPKLGSARIEVGRSLEHALTDLHMSRIARDQLAPYTAYGAAGMAMMDVLYYLRDHVYVSAAVGDLELEESFRNNPEYLRYQRFASGGAGAKAALSSTPLDADLKRVVPKGVRARYAPSADVEDSVAAFLRATAELAADPTLELFTEGSRLMRAYYPVARFEELQRLERVEASLPLEFLERGDYAVATSNRPAKGFVPILLRREQGLWRIDLVETWKNLFFNSEGDYFLRNSNTPYAFGLTQFGTGRRYELSALPLGTESIAGALAALDGTHGALSALRRAEVWLRNCFVFPQAYSAYQAARLAAPNDPLVLQTIGDRAVEIESVMLTSMGTAAASGLGDIKGYWRYPAGKNRLLAGESVSFDKLWGFTVDTGHEHVRYVFRTCWRGVDTRVRQCRTQWVDALP